MEHSTSTTGLPIKVLPKDTIKNLFINSINRLIKIGGSLVYDHVNRRLQIENDDDSNYHALSVTKLGYCDLVSSFSDKKWSQEMVLASQAKYLGKIISNTPIINEVLDYSGELVKIREVHKDAFDNLMMRAIRVISSHGYIENEILLSRVSELNTLKSLLDDIIQASGSISTKTSAFSDLRSYIRSINPSQIGKTSYHCYKWAHFSNIPAITNAVLDLYATIKTIGKKQELVVIPSTDEQVSDEETNDEFDPFAVEITYVDKVWGDEPSYEDSGGNKLLPSSFKMDVITPVQIQVRAVKSIKDNKTNFITAPQYWNTKFIDYLRGELTTRAYIDYGFHCLARETGTQHSSSLVKSINTLEILFPNFNIGSVMNFTIKQLKNINTAVVDIINACDYLLVTMLTEESTDESTYISTGEQSDYSDSGENIFGDDF